MLLARMELRLVTEQSPCSVDMQSIEPIRCKKLARRTCNDNATKPSDTDHGAVCRRDLAAQVKIEALYVRSLVLCEEKGLLEKAAWLRAVRATLGWFHKTFLN